jgi:hypothetical protein
MCIPPFIQDDEHNNQSLVPYDHGWIDALQDNNTTDTDGDGMSDVYEVINGLNLNSPADAVDAPVGHLPEGATATMNDFILNIERFHHGIPLSQVVTEGTEYQTLTAHPYPGGITHNFDRSVAENDWDGDGISNWDEVLVFHTDPRDPGDRPADADLLTAYLERLTSLTTSLHCVSHFASWDSDGDGIPDVVENQYGLDRTVNDSGGPRFINGETDGFTWKEAYDLGILGALVPHRLTVGGGGTYSVTPEPEGTILTIPLTVEHAIGNVAYYLDTSALPPNSLDYFGDHAEFHADPGPNRTVSFTYTVWDERTTPGGTATATILINITAPMPEADPTVSDEFHPYSTPVTVHLAGHGGVGPPYTFAITRQPRYGSIGAISPVDDYTATATYTTSVAGPVYDTFEFTVSDQYNTSAPATGQIRLWVEQPPLPAVSITAYDAGKVTDSLVGYSRPIAIIRPNDDNDDHPESTANPPPKDNANETIGENDDDIVRVWLAFSPGEEGRRATSGTVTVKLPANGFKIYTSPTGGTPLAAGPYPLVVPDPDSTAPDPNANSPLAGILTGGMMLYVETAPGDLVSGDITIESALELEDDSTAQPCATLPLLPVELLQHPIDAPSAAAAPPPSNKPIRFCRWIDAYPNGVRDNNFAHTDRDRFQIRIPGVIPGLTKMTIKSTGINGAMVNGVYQEKTADGDYEVDMGINNGAMVSVPILLVGDGDDDKTFNGVGVNDGKNDQTLLANFDSKIIVSFPELGNATATFVAQPAIGQIELDVVYCSPGGGVPANMETFINRQIYVMRGIYRQIGIKVKASGIRALQFPAAWIEAQDATDPAGNLTTTETDDLIRLLQAGRGGSGDKRVRAGFVDAALHGIGDDGNVVSIDGKMGGFGVCLVSLDADGKRHLNTLAHEVGHVCTLPHQRLYEDPKNRVGGEHWLMKDGVSWKNTSDTGKRFLIGVEDVKIKSPLNKYYVPIP